MIVTENMFQFMGKKGVKEVVFCETGDIKLSFGVSMLEDIPYLNYADLDLFYNLVMGFYIPVYNNGRFLYGDTKK